MSFDKILDLTAGVHFKFYYNTIPKQVAPIDSIWTVLYIVQLVHVQLL